MVGFSGSPVCRSRVDRGADTTGLTNAGRIHDDERPAVISIMRRAWWP